MLESKILDLINFTFEDEAEDLMFISKNCNVLDIVYDEMKENNTEFIAQYQEMKSYNYSTAIVFLVSAQLEED
ncbi:MAG: hypothetical protein EZS28_020820 [Streblomastix strix]|uniref:Uncharacterized protein n=1 Tax=Streblomastix strix TaxID=222440 RepID=A0A5J4VM50_9EUKA|nr:MAG: hypothetical protein EZS28_020820 [Streblomastix strix]